MGSAAKGDQLRCGAGRYQDVCGQVVPAIAAVNGIGLEDEAEGVAGYFGWAGDDAFDLDLLWEIVGDMRRRGWVGA